MSKRKCRNTGRTWFKKGYIPWNKGLKDCGCGFKKGHKFGFKKGYTPWNKGKKGLQKAQKTSFKPGKLNPCWNGGGRLKYVEGFTVKLRKQIRTRDKDTCQFCGSHYYLVVHHKDKKKINHSLDNLITLCASCHRKQHISTPHKA